MRDVIMNRTVSESDGTEFDGRRLNRSMSSGNAVRVRVGSPPIRAERDRRLRTQIDPDNESAAYNSRELQDFEDVSRSRLSKNKRGQDHMRSQRSMDSGSGSADGDTTTGDSTWGANSSSSSSNASAAPSGFPLKSIWKKTVNKLIKKMKTDEPTPEPIRETKSSSPAPESNAAGEIDPVYSFLKLTSVMPRQGTTNVIPGEGHRCCPGSKIDNLDEADIDESTYTHSTDPSKCQCPCHLPERLEACHHAWKKAFFIDKS